MTVGLIHALLPGRLVIIGSGSIARAVLPLLFRHIDIKPEFVTVLSATPDTGHMAQTYGVRYFVHPLTQDDDFSTLAASLDAGDFLLNLSVDVASLALIRWCWKRGVLYLDASTEPWAGHYDNPALTPSMRSNYALREEALAFRLDKRSGPTAVITQGANPGLASSLVKQALLNMAADCDIAVKTPGCYEDWAQLARRLDVRTIHVAEHDTQTTRERKKPNEFVNTWSVVGFVSEALQPAELGWGTHERHFPADGARHGYGCDAAIYLNQPGAATRVRSWTPLEGPCMGFLITHAESISIADHLTLRENGQIVYRPTVHYAYHPCDDAVLSLHELAGRNWRLQDNKRILLDEISEGRDELGVLLMGNERGVYWYGSRLTIGQARALAPHNSATSLQVAASVIAGMVWALRHPNEGLVEPDDVDHALILDLVTPYMGELVGVWGDWHPLKDRSPLFDEDIDKEDPWQFKNFRIS